MSSLIISGRRRLEGEVSIEGSKNAVLPILAATVLNGGINVIRNCPKFRDVETMLEILKLIGCKVYFEDDTVTIDSSLVNKIGIPHDLASEMRASILLAGALIGRFRKVSIAHPGGCEIGPRPIDLHIKALKMLGVRVNDDIGGMIQCDADILRGCDIQLDYPSVGATENIMLAAVFADGETYIRNAAKEPEILELQQFLRGIGAQVEGAGTSIIKICGIDKARNVEHLLISDRIVAGTYLVAAAATNGDVRIRNIIPEHVSSITSVLREMGCLINILKDGLRIRAPKRLKAIEILRTHPYPGFPTDMQAQLVSALSIARGTSVVIETVFENRFNYIEEIVKMGAKIKVEGRVAIIKGVKSLKGAHVNAKDLRGGAALIIAGLAADGDTYIDGLIHIDRGYVNIENKLTVLGASIQRTNRLLDPDIYSRSTV